MTTSETDDYIAIRRLQNRYADTCSRQTWVELHQQMLPDSTVTLDLPERQLVIEGVTELVGFISRQLAQYSFFQLVIRNAVIDLYPDGDPDAATGRMWMSEFRRHADDNHWSKIFGVYHDHYRRSPDGWRFEHRRYESLARP